MSNSIVFKEMMELETSGSRLSRHKGLGVLKCVYVMESGWREWGANYGQVRAMGEYNSFVPG